MMDAAFSQNAPDYVVIFCKCCHEYLYLLTTQIDEMETTRKVQTGLRLSPILIARLKQEARKNHKSFNGYVEDVLDTTTMPRLPKLKREDYTPSQEILQLGRTIPPFTQEELDNDPKLAYILSE